MAQKIPASSILGNQEAELLSRKEGKGRETMKRVDSQYVSLELSNTFHGRFFHRLIRRWNKTGEAEENRARKRTNVLKTRAYLARKSSLSTVTPDQLHPVLTLDLLLSKSAVPQRNTRGCCWILKRQLASLLPALLWQRVQRKLCTLLELAPARRKTK